MSSDHAIHELAKYRFAEEARFHQDRKKLFEVSAYVIVKNHQQPIRISATVM
jgi:hypothetical protein